MWSRLGAFLHQAVESREQAHDLLQSFVQHWKGVTQYYLETTDESCQACNTDIPWRLRQLLDILVYEEENTFAKDNAENRDKSGPADNTGPCMEYLLQHKILETLCTLAKAEYPPGMRQQVLLFFSRLLSKIERPLLHYINVHRPVQKMIALGGDTVGATAHKEEIQFLTSVCSKLEKDPSLIVHVLEGELVKRMSSTEAANEPATEPTSCKPKQTSLFRALLRLSLCQSQKGRLAVRAKEALLGVLRTAQQEGPAHIIAHSDLSQQLSERLCELHNDIPLSVHPCDITSQEDTNWRTEVSKEEFDAMPPEIAAVRRFLCWLKFCNSLLQECHEMVALSIANSITEVYLQGKLKEELLQVSELHILRSTAVITALLQHLKSRPFLHQLLIFLLGEEKGPERRNDKSLQLRSQLIQRCNHLSDEISLATMRLFEEMLQSSDQMALNSLVLGNLENRCYLAGGSEESRAHDGESFEGTDELEEDPYFTDGLPDTGLQMMPRRPRHHGEPLGSEQSMKSFLSLVPDEMKSSDSGFDSYLQDALVQHRRCCSLSSQWSWPSASAPQSLSNGPSGEEFYEGQFLQVLFDRLGGILDQPYEMNLQVTSLLTRIALFPHPFIQEYLLDPYINLAPGARSLFSVLVRVVADLAQRSQRVSNFQEMLRLVRQQLLGETPELLLGHETLCRGVVVLEEFCKELAAAACVTRHPLGV